MRVVIAFHYLMVAGGGRRILLLLLLVCLPAHDLLRLLLPGHYLDLVHSVVIGKLLLQGRVGPGRLFNDHRRLSRSRQATLVVRAGFRTVLRLLRMRLGNAALGVSRHASTILVSTDDDDWVHKHLDALLDCCRDTCTLVVIVSRHLGD